MSFLIRYTRSTKPFFHSGCKPRSRSWRESALVEWQYLHSREKSMERYDEEARFCGYTISRTFVNNEVMRVLVYSILYARCKFSLALFVNAIYIYFCNSRTSERER